jgi:hypothetical protein
MKSKLCLLTIAFLLVVTPNLFAALSGTGSQLSPYLIQSRADFAEWTSGSYMAAGIHSKLTTDIDLQGTTFSNIVATYYFHGNLNGNGHKIHNFTVTTASGVFKHIYGTVKNLTISDCTLTTGYIKVGGLCSKVESSGTVTNCHFKGTINSDLHYVGGIAGVSAGTISNSSVDADITAGTNYADSGVFVGGNYGTITNCYANGSIDAYAWMGGFVGINFEGAKIENCYSTAQVNPGCSNCAYIDGFVGKQDGIVQNCFLDVTSATENTSNTGVTELTSGEMMVEANFTAAGWDFANIWSMPRAGAPLFQWNVNGTYCLTPPFFDYTGDCLVNLDDFAAFAAAWLDCGYADQSLCP